MLMSTMAACLPAGAMHIFFTGCHDADVHVVQGNGIGALPNFQGILLTLHYPYHLICRLQQQHDEYACYSGEGDGTAGATTENAAPSQPQYKLPPGAFSGFRKASELPHSGPGTSKASVGKKAARSSDSAVGAAKTGVKRAGVAVPTCASKQLKLGVAGGSGSLPAAKPLTSVFNRAPTTCTQPVSAASRAPLATAPLNPPTRSGAVALGPRPAAPVAKRHAALAEAASRELAAESMRAMQAQRAVARAQDNASKVFVLD